jgi:hypothetical protein
LKVSDTGFWSYRRVVPKHLRPFFEEHREWKKAFKTKDKTKAFKLHAEYHQEVEYQIQVAEQLLAKAKSASHASSRFDKKLYTEPTIKWRGIYKRLHSQKRLPHQAPKLDVTATETNNGAGQPI